MPRLREYNEDIRLNAQNKHYVETPEGQTRYVTAENLFGGLRMFANSLTRNLQRAIDITGYTNVGGFNFSGSTSYNSKFNVLNNVIYIPSNADALGIYYSADDGATWTNKTTGDGLGSNTCIQIHINNNKIYVATLGGLSISTNGGASFTNYTTLNGLPENACYSVFAVGSTIIIGTTSYVCYSTDSGTTWTNQLLSTNEKPVVYIDNNKMYALGQASGYLYKSTDYSSFTLLNNVGAFVRSIYADLLTIYLCGSSGVKLSTDGGATFTTKTTIEGLGSNDCYDILYYDGKIYVATNGGISISSDGGASFTNYTTAAGLGNNQLYAVTASTTAKIYALSYNGVGTEKLNISNTIWQRINAGAGTTIEHDVSANSVDIYATTAGAAGSTATLTQIFRATISAITAFLGLSVSDTTDSSSSVTGSLKTAGGLGVAKKAYIGTDLSIGGNVITKIKTTDTTASTSKTTGSGIFGGGVGVAGDINTDHIYTATSPTVWRADTHAGYGSTDTKIPYFTNVRTNNILNSDITMTNNSTNGCKVLINNAGLYEVSFAFESPINNYGEAVISLNSSQLTTNGSAINAADRIAMAYTCPVASYPQMASVTKTLWLAANDIIRPHSNALTPNTAAYSIFSIVRII